MFQALYAFIVVLIFHQLNKYQRKQQEKKFQAKYKEIEHKKEKTVSLFLTMVGDNDDDNCPDI